MGKTAVNVWRKSRANRFWFEIAWGSSYQELTVLWQTFSFMKVSYWICFNHQSLLSKWLQCTVPTKIILSGHQPGGGVLRYIAYMGMCRPKGSWFWSSWFRTGHFLEWGMIFRTHESSTIAGSHLKVFKDRLLLKIRFNALTSKPLYSLLPPRTE